MAINEGERLLGVPYPAPAVTMRRITELEGGFCGQNQPDYAPRYVGDPYVMDSSVIEMRVDEDCDDSFAIIAHEVAHTWFHGSDVADWIDEGLANAIELQVVAANQPGEVSYPPVTYCHDYRNISELERGNPARVSDDAYTGFRCHYSFGDGIFGALKEHHGVAGFNERIARLARRVVNLSYDEHAIDDIRRILGDNPLALQIINHWYDGEPEMQRYRHLDAVEWTFPPTIDGEYLHFAGKVTPADVVHHFVLGDDPYCSQFALRSGIGDEEWVQSVSRPLQAGRTHHQDSKVITINHDIDSDSGAFRVTARILDNALSGVPDLSLSVKERVTVGPDGNCLESINYGQIPLVTGRIPIEFKQAEYFHLDAVEWTFPPTIDGEYLHFAGRIREPGLVHNFVLGDDAYCSQFTLYRNVINQEWVASVSDPLLVGWNYDEVPDLMVVNDSIDPTTGEFSVTARINAPGLKEIPELSLLVRSRVTVGTDNLCGRSDSYSQVAVSRGIIPAELKVIRHYHLDVIQWTEPPKISGATLAFAGVAEPGTITLKDQDDYCGQFSLYVRDKSGYHRVTSVAPLLPDGWEWTNPQSAEFVKGWTYTDGKFNATARLSSDLLSRHPNLILVVRTAAAVDAATGECSSSEVLSAIDIQRN